MLPPRQISLARRAVRVLVTALAVLGVLTVAERPASAYVRARSRLGFAPKYWRDPRQVLEVARPPKDTGITADQLLAASKAALGAWSHEAISCTSVDLSIAPELTDDQIAKRDGRNRIAMRVGQWCRDPAHPTDSTCHIADAIAVTVIFSVDHPGLPDDGRILEADIEINAVGQYQWGMIPDPPFSGRDYANVYDLTSALTHEAGHFIGLDHTCGVDSTQRALLDDKDQMVAYCDAIPGNELALVEGATMYPRIPTADVSVRTLSDDDKAAACAIYPLNALPLDEWGGMGGCTTAAAPQPRGAKGALLAFFALASLIVTGWLARRFRSPVRVSSRTPRR